MLACVLGRTNEDGETAANSNDRSSASGGLESRRREIKALLEDIRAPAPSPTDIIRVVEQAGAGSLDEVRLDRIAAGIRSLYRAG